MNAYGSSVTRVSAPRWRLTVLPCMANQMVWTILGVGKAYVGSSFWNFSQHIGLLLLRRVSPYGNACSAERRTASRLRLFPRRPKYGQGPRHFWPNLWYWSLQGV